MLWYEKETMMNKRKTYTFSEKNSIVENRNRKFYLIKIIKSYKNEKKRKEKPKQENKIKE